MAYKDQLDHKDHKVLQDHKDQQGLMVKMVHKDHKVRKVQ